MTATRTPSDSDRGSGTDIDTVLRDAKAAIATDISNKLRAREVFIGEAKKTADLITEAKETLSYYERVSRAGQLSGSAEKNILS